MTSKGLAVSFTNPLAKEDAVHVVCHAAQKGINGLLVAKALEGLAKTLTITNVATEGCWMVVAGDASGFHADELVPDGLVTFSIEPFPEAMAELIYAFEGLELEFAVPSMPGVAWVS